ncbi:MAG: GNAT family N-acetyltransferase [Trueperaceae bacterium]|nr:GNAT family N-acetyltransferase [Trueperaceae bacterium]
MPPHPSPNQTADPPSGASTRQTDRAKLHVDIVTCSPARNFADLAISDALGMFRPAKQQKLALIDIADDDKCCVSIARDDDLVVGYAAFHPPTAVESWGGDRSGEIIELGAVEVDPSYRGQHLAQRLLEASFAGGRFDHTIVIATMYVWHYDLKQTGLSSLDYRRMLERLYQSVGMEPFRTSDPEIRSDPANQLMARIGPNCPSDVRQEFDRLRSQQLAAFGV